MNMQRRIVYERELTAALENADVTAYGPYKADYGCHGADIGSDAMLWHVHDTTGEPIAFFWHEEDALAFAALSNAARETHRKASVGLQEEK